MDAEYFQPKYADIENRIKGYKGGYLLLSDIVNCTKGYEVGSEAYTDNKNDIPFIRVSDVSVNGINRTEKTISHELYQSLKDNYSPKKNDVLMTKDGTLGISFVIDEDIKAILCGAFLKMQIKIDMNPYCLAIILNSLICKMQIEKLCGGAIIEHLTPSNALSILIPNIPHTLQTQIATNIQKSNFARKQSRKLLEIAKQAVEMAIEQNESVATEFVRLECEKIGVRIE